jgi:hypothetical protein
MTAGPGARPARGVPVAVALGALALAAAVVNVGKAVHVDDTAYLEIARWIAGHPLHPMSGAVNWGDAAEPISHVSQPHLLFYLMAAVMAAAPGHVELAMHLVWALLSGATIVLFYALARALDTPRPLAWTAVFALGPAFLPAQNVMVDVPLVGLWLACFVALARADGERPWRHLLLAALAASAACLVKYTSLALLPMLTLAIWWRGDRRRLVVLLVPAAALAGWSLFNRLDYGGIHLLERPVTSAKAPGLAATAAHVAGRAGLWLIALGAVVPGTPVFAGVLARARAGRALLAAAAAVAVVTAAVGRIALPAEPAVQSILRGLFLGNGCFAAGLAVRGFRQGPAGFTRRLLAVWALGAAAFIVLLSLFIAVRHALVALPALLLLVARGPDAAQLSRRAARLGVALTALGGLVLAVSDARLAGVYREAAPALAARFCPPGVRCVTVGHWGWQWYAGRAGLVAYDRDATVLAPGDRLIVPELVSKQTLRPDDAARLLPLAEVAIPSTPATFVRTIATEHSAAQGDRSGGFYYFWTSVPWTLTTRPLDRFQIYAVRATAADGR